MKNLINGIGRRGGKLAASLALGLGLILGFPAASVAQTNVATPPLQPPPPPPKWDVSLVAGLTVTGGNTQTLLATGNFRATHKTPKNEFLFGGDGAYGKDTTGTNDIKSAESLSGFAQYNHLVTTRLYYGLRLDALHDAIAGVNYRFTVAPLGGYYFIKSTNTSLSAEFGPAYVYERKTGADPDGFATLRVAERFEHKIDDKTKIWESIEFLPRVEHFDNYYASAEVGFDTALTKHTGWTTYLDDTYYSMPTPGRLKNDIKLVTGIKYTF